MLKGYGKILRLDLTSKKISYDQLDDKTARKYIGGVGLAAKLLWDETDAKTGALAPESPLIFMTGPLTGTAVPKSSRYIVSGISPATNIWGQAHSGGAFADELRHAGIDGVIVTGQAKRPVYLWIHDGEAELRDAAHVWGKDTYQVSDALQQATDPKASVACIGVAGEKLVKIAGIMNDGIQGRAAARCGLGALMGSKKLKAIVARGTLPIPLHDEGKLKESANKILASSPLRKPEDWLVEAKGVFDSFITKGRMSAKNFSQGTFPAAHVYPAVMPGMLPLHCKRCPWSCLESLKVPGGERHAVWESWSPLGSQCLIADAEAMQEAYSLCNRYGIDTISAGAVISFAFECYDKGLINKADTDGIELTWGNHKAVLELIKKIGEREGFGDLLSEGVKIAAERIGGTASEYAMHVKGLEFPAHDPRSMPSHALDYATGCIGASHMEAVAADHLENWAEDSHPKRSAPELGYPVPLKHWDEVGKGRLVAKTQDVGALVDSVVVCLYLSLIQWVQPSQYAQMLNSACGWDLDKDELLLTGERISNLRRMFSYRRASISRKDDILPARILTQKLDGGTKGYIPHLGLMLNEYYTARGWSEEGIPTKEKLTQLGLQECL